MTVLPKVLPLLAALILAGCNTVAGVGQDLSEAGTTIEQEARAAE
jgi:predicted small secreted protein